MNDRTLARCADYLTGMPSFLFGAPVTHQPYADGCVYMPTATASVSTVANDIVIYPNPVFGSFSISGVDKISELTIIDMMGRTVYKIDSAECQSPVSVPHLRPGCYTTRIIHDDGICSYKKIMIAN